MLIISSLLVVAFTSSLENLSSIYPLFKSVFFISTDVIKSFGFSVAFKNDIKIFEFFSLPKIFLNTKSILGSSSPFIIITSLNLLYFDYTIINLYL